VSNGNNRSPKLAEGFNNRIGRITIDNTIVTKLHSAPDVPDKVKSIMLAYKKAMSAIVVT